MKMGDSAATENEELKKQLREILAEQWQARLEVLRLERERVTGRLTKLDEDISRLERDRDSVIEGHLKSLTNAAGGNGGKSKVKPGDKRSNEKVVGDNKPTSPTTSAKSPSVTKNKMPE